MKKNQSYLYIFLSIVLVLFLAGCRESNPEKDNIFQRLKVNAKINTFSLTIVTSEGLNSNAFPEDLKNLCILSKSSVCKTLPDAGVLRLGPNVFHGYNCISELKVADSIENNEAAITQMVDKKVTDYYANKTLIKDYDSLLTPNRGDWNVRSLLLNYIDNTIADSIFFFSNKPNAPELIQARNKQYTVYNNSNELRNKIDRLICMGTGAISVFYNAPSLDSFAVITPAKTNWPKKDTYAGDTCVQFSKYQKLHNGSGGFKVGNLIAANSKSCGFVFPTGFAGDTCIKGSKYQKLYNGKGGFKVGILIEQNSKSCGFIFPARGTRAAGFINYNEGKYEKLHDGSGGFIRGNLIEEKKDVKKVVTAPEIPNTKKPVVIPPKKTPVTVPVRDVSNNNKTKSGSTSKPEPSNGRCASKSDPLCEKDSDGNYTGRRVQYCYDKNGRIVQTVVLAKCDSDCRCF